MPWICTASPSDQGPRPLAGDGQASLVEHGDANAGIGLGEPLCRRGAEGEVRVHKIFGQVGHGTIGALGEHLVTDALQVCDAVIDGGRSLTVGETRRMHGVPAGPNLAANVAPRQ
jgi:hypothetical protein